MAYRPTIVRPPPRQNPAAIVQSQIARKALVQALAFRLQQLVGSLGQTSSQPVPAQNGPTARVPVPTSALPPLSRQNLAPSAQDWVRMPGFYESGEMPSRQERTPY